MGANHHKKYVDLIQRHLGRKPLPTDGMSDDDLAKTEKRLKTRLPDAMRDYYLLAGRLEALNKAHNQLFDPDRLRIEGGHLWFMEENQAVVHWGIPIEHLSESDPPVFQRENVEKASWFSEELKFSTFLVRMYDWQGGLADAPE